jgi:hypothetical protein
VSDLDLDRWIARSGALDLADLDWDAVRAHPIAPEALRVLRYMQDIEGHTSVYVRQLLATRAIDDPEIATFPACWFHEETFHSRALDRGSWPRPGRRSDPGRAPAPQPASSRSSRSWRWGSSRVPGPTSSRCT